MGVGNSQASALGATHTWLVKGKCEVLSWFYEKYGTLVDVVGCVFANCPLPQMVQECYQTFSLPGHVAHSWTLTLSGGACLQMF